MRTACVKRESMTMDFGLESGETCFPRKFRWLLQIEDISGVAEALPPLRGARPQMSFREQMVPHLVEDIYFPVRPDWKPIQLTLFDIKNNENPVFDWMEQVYQAQEGTWSPIFEAGCLDEGSACFKRNADLCMYGGCGDVIEKWRYENAWPQTINWGDLDMGDSGVVTVEVTLRYDRAYLKRD